MHPQMTNSVSQQTSVIFIVLPFILSLLLTERVQLKLDAAAVYTTLGLNERLFICTSSQVEQLVRTSFLPYLLFFLFSSKDCLIIIHGISVCVFTNSPYMIRR